MATDIMHIKLRGGSSRTAPHDKARMDDARREVASRNAAEEMRARKGRWHSGS